MSDTDSKNWCPAGGQPLGPGAPQRSGDLVVCEDCGRPVKAASRFGGLFVYPRHMAASFDGGARVVQRLMLRSMGRTLSERQAVTLWAECTAVLKQRKLQSTIREALRSTDGGLDTLEREDIQDALGFVLTGKSWPLYSTPNDEWGNFEKAMRDAVTHRGYVELQDAAT